jgi:hypothetical protein
MFIAKFTQTSNTDIFKADHNDHMPFIGDIVAGVAKGSIINGTMFKRGNFEENALYLCDNHTDPEYPDNVQTTVITKVGVLEFLQLRKDLGAGKLKRETVEDGVEADA